MTVKEKERSLKILLIGDTAVGKSSLLSRFVDDKFDENLHPTVGVEFASKCITIDETKLKLLIWDLGGQQQYRSITDSFCSGAHGVIAVFDLTREDSFEKLKRRLQELNGHWDGNVKKILVGNKYDLTYERVVGRETAKSLADSLNMQYAETSAKRPIYVEEMFKMLCNEIISIPKPESSIEKCLPRDESVQDEVTITPIYDYSFKIIILGDHGVGKTSLFLRFVEDSFCEKPRKSLGIDIKCCKRKIIGKNVMLQLWNIASQKDCRTVIERYYQGTSGVIVAFDLTDKASFDNIEMWLQNIKQYGSNDVKILIAGNKCDLTSQRAIDEKTIKLFAESKKLLYAETSAKDGINVEQEFNNFFSKILTAKATLQSNSESRFASTSAARRKLKAKSSLMKGSKDFDREYLLKFVLVGDSTVGKSSLMLRFTDDTFNEVLMTSIGVEFGTQMICRDGAKINLKIWDTAGVDKFHIVPDAYFRGAHGIILVYDVTNLKSFQNIEKWLRITRNNVAENARILLVGNKCDLALARVVDYADAEEYAYCLNVSYMETSAKDSVNVQKAFYYLVSETLSTRVNLLSRSEHRLACALKMDGKHIPFTERDGCDCDYFLKLLLLGDHGVGKSALFSCFTDDAFTEVSDKKIQVAFRIRIVDHDEQKIGLEFWDVGGLENFRTEPAAYFPGADAIILVYDVTNLKSFQNIEKWLRIIGNNVAEDAIILLVGNKCDLASARVVDATDAEEYASCLGVSYMETSVKDSINVKQLFTDLIDEIVPKKSIDERILGHFSIFYATILEHIRSLSSRLWSNHDRVLR